MTSSLNHTEHSYDSTNRKPRPVAFLSRRVAVYVRVSGTWANTSYFADSDQPPTTPPAGFGGVLSHEQWKGVVDFANAVNARIVTSFATGRPRSRF